jgi:hypothetical protein
MIFSTIRRFLVKEAVRSIDISKALPIAKVNKVGKSKPAVRTLKRTVITDVMENPEAFILEAWLDKNEINVRVRRRFEENEVEEGTVLVDTVDQE